jgi:hypothetical protein
MSQLVDGIRVITEGPPPIRDLTDPPSIPVRFTPPPARDRSWPPAASAPVEPTTDEQQDDDEEATATVPILDDRAATPDTLVEGSLDPDWDRLDAAPPDRAEAPSSALPSWWIGVGLAAVAVALAGVGTLALW